MKTMIGSRPMNLIDADQCPCLICAGATCEQGHAMRCGRFKEWVKTSEVGFKVRRKGTWAESDTMSKGKRFTCSVCGNDVIFQTRLNKRKCAYTICPHCGSVMDI